MLNFGFLTFWFIEYRVSSNTVTFLSISTFPARALVAFNDFALVFIAKRPTAPQRTKDEVSFLLLWLTTYSHSIAFEFPFPPVSFSGTSLDFWANCCSADFTAL